LPFDWPSVVMHAMPVPLEFIVYRSVSPVSESKPTYAIRPCTPDTRLHSLDVRRGHRAQALGVIRSRRPIRNSNEPSRYGAHGFRFAAILVPVSERSAGNHYVDCSMAVVPALGLGETEVSEAGGGHIEP
jgi:hypothetical protein